VTAAHDAEVVHFDRGRHAAIVSQSRPWSGKTTPVRTIVVGYDGSDAARRALGRAADLAGGDARVVVVHATHPLYPRPYDMEDPDEEARSDVLLEEARQLLGGRGIDAETRSPAGGAAEQLVAAAKEVEADAIVVGRRRSTAAHMLGSVSSRVVEEAPCDVLVVR
jgi:nucleotide-binding universal stress UspA family protein